jgi:7-cyano-7-deazaguanine synthase
MYTSILSAIKVGDVELNDKWWMFFILPIPAIITATVAYMLGSKEIHFTKLLLPVTPEELEIKREKNAKCPTTVVEGRNAFFLLAAAVWAKSLGATVIYTGVSEADFSGYPDCRNDFIKAQQKSMRLALDWPVKIVTPFMRKTKAEEWEMADRLGILDLVKNETVTCYNGIPGEGCKKCPACKLRNRGLKEFEKSRALTSKARRARG